jgi:hypothetical protein
MNCTFFFVQMKAASMHEDEGWWLMRRSCKEQARQITDGSMMRAGSNSKALGQFNSRGRTGATLLTFDWIGLHRRRLLGLRG